VLNIVLSRSNMARRHQIKRGPVVHLEHLPAKPIKLSSLSLCAVGSALMRDNVKAIIPIVFASAEREKKSTLAGKEQQGAQYQ
jgi:hypothetical protein